MKLPGSPCVNEAGEKFTEGRKKKRLELMERRGEREGKKKGSECWRQKRGWTNKEEGMNKKWREEEEDGSEERRRGEERR